jgi:hypothetical protein
MLKGEDYGLKVSIAQDSRGASSRRNYITVMHLIVSVERPILGQRDTILIPILFEMHR